jgi:hypothetical protein
MVSLKSLLLFSFISLYNTFLTNFNIPNPNKLKYNLNMGCDYYIDKSLYFYDFENIQFTFIHLERDRGYYSYYKDEDEPNYDFDYQLYKLKTLTPSMEPIVIYSNYSFSNLSFEQKYKKLIEHELNNCNKKWNDINIIIKKEERTESF